MTSTDEQLEMWDNGQTYECFHNLDIRVTKAEIRGLHHSAHLLNLNKKKMLKVSCCQSSRILQAQKTTLI